MKKKVLTLLFSLVLCLCIATSACAQTAGFASEYERVQDWAGLLSDN